MPSSTSTVWVRIGGSVSWRPAIAAIPTAIIEPEISPPGRPREQKQQAAGGADDKRLHRAQDLGTAWPFERQGGGDLLHATLSQISERRTIAATSCRNACASRRSTANRSRDGFTSCQRRRWRRCRPCASFMHSRRNFLRSLPFSPLASACLEHSSDSGRVLLRRLLVGGAAVVGLGVGLGAGAAVCAKAVPVASREARATTARRDVKVMVLHSSCGNCEGRERRLALLNAT